MQGRAACFSNRTIVGMVPCLSAGTALKRAFAFMFIAYYVVETLQHALQMSLIDFEHLFLFCFILFFSRSHAPKKER